MVKRKTTTEPAQASRSSSAGPAFSVHVEHEMPAVVVAVFGRRWRIECRAEPRGGWLLEAVCLGDITPEERAAREPERIAVGTRVSYAAHFLHSLRASPTDPIWRACGTVRRLVPFGDGELALVRWDREFTGYPRRIHARGLRPLSQLEHAEAAFRDLPGKNPLLAQAHRARREKLRPEP